jgi:hypothetical protein
MSREGVDADLGILQTDCCLYTVLTDLAQNSGESGEEEIC